MFGNRERYYMMEELGTDWR